MKKHILKSVVALLLVVGIFVGSPAVFASARYDKSLGNVEECDINTISVNRIRFSISDTIGNISNWFNKNNNWLNVIVNRYNKVEETPDVEEPEVPETPNVEEPEVPETPDVEEPEVPETPDVPETPAPEVSEPEVPKTHETPAELKTEQARMLELVNQERTKAGLKPLAWDGELARVADFKAQDMVQNNYFDHTSPTYGSPFDMMKDFGIKYRAAGENLAGYNTVDKAHVGLMNSDGHRANILNSNFTHVGIGVQKSPRYGYVFVQMFIGK